MCGIESPEGEQRMAARAKVYDILVADCSGRYKLCVTIRLKRFAVLSVTVCLSLETWGQAPPGTTRPPQPVPPILFQIPFQRGEPISALSSPAIRLPFQRQWKARMVV